MLTKEQQEWALAKFRQWADMLPNADVASYLKTSSLLPRLLSGKDPLPYPPPVVNGRYCHALYDEPDKPVLLHTGPVATLNAKKYKFYVAVDTVPDYYWISEAEGILIHKNGDQFRVWKGDCESKCELSEDKYTEERWMMQLHKKTLKQPDAETITRATAIWAAEPRREVIQNERGNYTWGVPLNPVPRRGEMGEFTVTGRRQTAPTEGTGPARDAMDRPPAREQAADRELTEALRNQAPADWTGQFIDRENAENIQQEREMFARAMNAIRDNRLRGDQNNVRVVTAEEAGVDPGVRAVGDREVRAEDIDF